MLMPTMLTRKLVAVVLVSASVVACSPPEPEQSGQDSVLLELEQALSDGMQKMPEPLKAFEREAIAVEQLLADEQASPEQQAEGLRMLNLELRRYVGVPYADGLSQCRMAEVGARPCGGPDYYLPYSLATTDEFVVVRMVQRYSDLKRELNQKQQLMGTCEVIAPPKLTYAGGQCIGLPYHTE